MDGGREGKAEGEGGVEQDVREEVILQALDVRKEGPDEVAFAVFLPMVWITAGGSVIQRWWTTTTAVA